MIYANGEWMGGQLLIREVLFQSEQNHLTSHRYGLGPARSRSKGGMMLDHVGLKTKNLDVLVRFYDAVLPPLGFKKIFENREGAAFGIDGLPELWIVQIDNAGGGANIAFRSDDRDGVDIFFDNALAAGALNIGSPMLRPEFHRNHYAAFVTDPDGNNLSAVCHADAMPISVGRQPVLAS